MQPQFDFLPLYILYIGMQKASMNLCIAALNKEVGKGDTIFATIELRNVFEGADVQVINESTGIKLYTTIK